MTVDAETTKPAVTTKRPLRPFGARWIALAGGTLIALYLCWLMLAPFVDVLLWAGVLAIVAWPLHRRWLKRTGSPSGAAAITCLVVVLTVLIPLSLVTLMVVREAREAAHGLPEQARRLLDPESAAMKWAGRYVDVEKYVSREFVAERLKAVSAAMAGRTLGVVGNVLGAVVQIFFVLFALYYLLRDHDRVVGTLYESVPLEREQAERIFARTEEVIGASVYGVMVISAVQGLLGAIAFWALGLPSPLLWGVVMFLLSMIPMAGAFIVWGPAALLLLATGHWAKALMLAAWGGLVIGMIDNVLRPRLVGEKAKLHELLIFFSVLGGLQVFGVLGLVVGPVVLAIALALVEVFREMERERGGGAVAVVAGAGAKGVVVEEKQVEAAGRVERSEGAKAEGDRGSGEGAREERRADGAGGRRGNRRGRDRGR